MAKPPQLPRDDQNDNFDDWDLDSQGDAIKPPPLPAPRQPVKRKSKPIIKAREQSGDHRILWYSLGGGGAVALIVLAVLLFLPKSTKPKPDASRTAVAEATEEKPVPAERPVDITSVPVKESTPDDASRSEELPVAEAPASISQTEPPVETEQTDANADVQVAEQEMETDPAAVKVDDPSDATELRQEPLIIKAGQLVASIKGKPEKDALATFKEAVTTLRRASNLHPKEIRADFYLGLLHSGVGIGEPKTAEVHFNRVLERSPGHVPTLNNLALINVKVRRFPVVRNYLGQAIKADPRPKEAVQNLGRVFAQSRLLELKGEELKKITTLNTDVGGYQSSIGFLYMPLDDAPKSLEEYRAFCRDGNLEDPSCLICNGRSQLICKKCEGHGSLLHSGTVNDVRMGLYGAISSSTPVVTANACPTCGGRGRIDCTVCVNGRDPTLNPLLRR